ncbi:MAG: matrixin family metalloprotease [Opitutus sp.]|nr:matrixin family metalloprotease [Opitutus sp.]
MRPAAVVFPLLFRRVFLLTLLGVAGSHAHAYSLSGPRWRTPTVTIQLQLGANPTPLSDSSANWGAVAEDALNTWNVNIGTTKFAVVRDSTAARAEGNRINNVFFSADIYGTAWGNGVLAVTLSFSSAGSSVEADVLFNSRLNWDSYRGALRTAPNGGSLQDFHRVAMHEFGHVLGLDHPDQHGQNVTALMNSRVGALDTIAADDINGAQALYGAPPAPAPIAPPTITTQPTSRTVAAGQSTTFSVVATSATPLTYQWLKAGAPLAGRTASTFTLASITTGDAGNYSVTVTNSAGSVTSVIATLTVNAAGTPGGTAGVAPTITVPPASQSVLAGAGVTFSVTATGTAPLSYQWRKDGTVLGGATAASLTLANVQPADGGGYTVLVVNAAGAIESAPATLTVSVPVALPSISAAPVAQTVAVGERISLRVVATSSVAITYQWFKDNEAIPEATGTTFVLAAARASDTGSYTVRITNSVGSVTTDAVIVAVQFSRLINLSTRAFIPAGGALIPGFFIRGGNPKALLIRAVGPTLALFGVRTALADATLDVFAQGSATVVAANDDWGGALALSNAFASVGAFPLAAASKDAALQTVLAPAGYTARITAGDNTTSGVTLAEIYDTETLSGASSQLVNVSTLGFVGTGDNVLTAGFVISGNATKRLLIRAVGPGLAPFGVTGLLTDPQLGLVPLGKIEPIATNDDWPDQVNVRAAFVAAGAFALTPGSKDAALVITLEPGGYTVIVSGVSSSATGNALVEIYDLDP